jgi:AbrB family looped-hinge helix DNA binding protein
MTVVTARLDERGRLVLPAKLRHRLDLHPGDELVIVDEPDGVRLKSRRVAARSLIGLAGTADHCVVDELRRQREREVADEDAAAGQRR